MAGNRVRPGEGRAGASPPARSRTAAWPSPPARRTAAIRTGRQTPPCGRVSRATRRPKDNDGFMRHGESASPTMSRELSGQKEEGANSFEALKRPRPSPHLTLPCLWDETGTGKEFANSTAKQRSHGQDAELGGNGRGRRARTAAAVLYGSGSPGEAGRGGSGIPQGHQPEPTTRTLRARRFERPA